jgi:transcription elongation factor Elf1
MYNTCECPYCGHENDMTDALSDLSSDNTLDWECRECEEEFQVYVEFDPIYNASKIIYKDCEICGDHTRYFYEEGSISPFPKKHKGKVICKKCWTKGVFEEMEEDK